MPFPKVHFPGDEKEMLAARRRLVFDEFFFFILGIRKLKEARKEVCHSYVLKPAEDTDRLIAGLPYQLTGAQKKSVGPDRGGYAEAPGYGKTGAGRCGIRKKPVIAFLALLMAAGNGGQGALMVPTEVLARQHYEAFCALTRKCGIACRAVLLTGSLKASEKRDAYSRIESGEASVIIGTHALIQEKGALSQADSGDYG